jgi:predicted DsbA family dithiol-disulfide isomerase
VAAAGAGEGTHFAFDRMDRTPNTLDAHRLVWLAGEEGVRDIVVEALFRAYFTEGQNVSTRQTLLDVAAEAGLDRGKAEGLLATGGGQEAIREADALARRVGVEGVPYFIINGAVTLSGAQPPEAFLTAFSQATGP